ncbi:MAG: ACP S-malonyltransferase [Chlamydiota bacterium]
MNYNEIAFLFPGQGAQYVGMGKDFYANFAIARETFEEADDILGQNLTRLIFEGPKEKLTSTLNSQPAIYVTSIAILRVLQANFPLLTPKVCAGLSLGEYSALTAAGIMKFDDGLPLVHKRARYMDESCLNNPGTMAAVVGLKGQDVERIVSTLPVQGQLWVANYNCPGQIVISGTQSGVSAGAEALKDAGAKKVMPLEVSGAFHSGLMKSAEKLLSEEVASLRLRDSSIGVVMNVTADYTCGYDAIKDNLVKQVTGSVRWEQSIRTMDARGVDLFIEIGCGKTLTTFNRRIKPQGRTLSIEKPQDLDSLSEVLSC